MWLGKFCDVLAYPLDSFTSLYNHDSQMLMIRYELQAVRLARLKQMSMENESIPDVSTCEVEMLETKQKTHAAHEISLEDSDCHDNIKNWYLGTDFCHNLQLSSLF